MKIIGEKLNAIFIERINRFEAAVIVNNQIEIAHVPNTGRMKELLIKGTEVILIKSDNQLRKTKYSLAFVKKSGNWVYINSIFANRVFEEAVNSGKIKGLEGKVIREVAYHNSRIDFFIDGKNKTFVEVKCGTYEENGVVMFPDAPTERGRRHVEEMMRAVDEGYSALVVIIAFMDYVKEFTPNYKIDQEFGMKLERAFRNGVDVKAYRCSIDMEEIFLDKEIDVYFR